MPLLLPGTGSECLFHYRQPLRDTWGHSLPQGHLICPRELTCQLAPPQPLAFIAVRFKSGQLRHFTALPFAAMHDQLLDVCTLWPRHAEALVAHLTLSVDCRTRIARLESFLLEQLRHHVRETEQAPDRLIEQLYYAPNLRIDALAEQWGWSSRHLERRFKQAFALTPKRFARLARLHHTLRQLALHPAPSTLDIALERGYSDQSHFIHEARALTGLAPGQLQHLLRNGTHYYHSPSRLPD
jgi:AraC-like DNA-binding protein